MTSSAVLFAASTSVIAGRGHLNRCLAISDALQKTGVVTALFDPHPDDEAGVTSLLPSHMPFLTADGEASQFLSQADNSILFLDNYAYRSGPPDIPGVEGVSAIAMLDDFGDTPPGVDMLFRLTRSDDSEVAAETPHIFEGEHLAPMRHSFFEARRRRSPDGSLLICLGASPMGREATNSILSSLEQSGCKKQINVAVPLGETEASSLKQRFSGLDLQVHPGIADLSPLMAVASRAICSPSVTSYELAVLGVPMLAVQIADNQARLGQHLQNRAAARVLCFDKVSRNDLKQGLAEFLGLNTLNGNPSGLRCDGLGAQRIARHLCGAMSPDPKTELRLEIATRQDLELLYRLQCLPEIRAHARNPEPPTHDEHIDWFTKMLADPARELFILIQEQAVVGFVRVDRLQDGGTGYPDQYEISIAVDPAFWAGGVATQALNYLFDLLPDDIFIAHVLPENDRSHGLFRRTGFVWRDDRYERPPSVVPIKPGLESVS